MATLKRQKSDGTWEHVQVVGSNVISEFNTHLADNAAQFEQVNSKLSGSTIYAYKNIGGAF